MITLTHIILVLKIMITKQFFPLIKEIYPTAKENEAILDIGGNIIKN